MGMLIYILLWVGLGVIVHKIAGYIADKLLKNK